MGKWTLGTGFEYLLKVHHHPLASHDDGDGAVGNRGLESPQVHDGFFVGEKYVDHGETPGLVDCEEG